MLGFASSANAKSDTARTRRKSRKSPGLLRGFCNSGGLHTLLPRLLRDEIFDVDPQQVRLLGDSGEQLRNAGIAHLLHALCHGSTEVIQGGVVEVRDVRRVHSSSPLQ